jgi:hypothetical protein
VALLPDRATRSDEAHVPDSPVPMREADILSYLKPWRSLILEFAEGMEERF